MRQRPRFLAPANVADGGDGLPLGSHGCLGDAVQNRQYLRRYGFLTFSA
jgi:hypothetical protein